MDLVGVAAEKTRDVRSEGRHGDVGPVDVVTSDDLADRSAGPATAASAECRNIVGNARQVLDHGHPHRASGAVGNHHRPEGFAPTYKIPADALPVSLPIIGSTTQFQLHSRNVLSGRLHLGDGYVKEGLLSVHHDLHRISS